jgi:hypothetical protein
MRNRDLNRKFKQFANLNEAYYHEAHKLEYFCRLLVVIAAVGLLLLIVKSSTEAKQ